MLIPDVGLAQACPHAFNNAANAIAFVTGTAPTSFFGPAHLPCETSKVGSPAPISCPHHNSGGSPMGQHDFTVVWASQAARTGADSNAGCRFNCGTPTTGETDPTPAWSKQQTDSQLN